MRQKEFFGTKPSKYEIVNGEHGATVKLRKNIKKNGEQWEADEYIMDVPKSKNLDRIVGDNFDEWVARAKYRDQKNAEESVRTKRNELLAESDAMMVSDRPTDKEAWAAYRQELRDIPKQAGFPYDTVFPKKP